MPHTDTTIIKSSLREGRERALQKKEEEAQLKREKLFLGTRDLVTVANTKRCLKMALKTLEYVSENNGETSNFALERVLRTTTQQLSNARDLIKFDRHGKSDKELRKSFQHLPQLECEHGVGTHPLRQDGRTCNLDGCVGDCNAIICDAPGCLCRGCVTCWDKHPANRYYIDKSGLKRANPNYMIVKTDGQLVTCEEDPDFLVPRQFDLEPLDETVHFAPLDGESVSVEDDDDGSSSSVSSPAFQPMSEEMKENGITVLCLAGDDTEATLEAWCQKVARLSGQQVDWFTCGGRDGIKVLGDDVEKAVVAVLANMHQLKGNSCVYWDNIHRELGGK